MELPAIEHPIMDRAAGVKYVVLAYRTLSRDEIVQMVRMHQSQAKRKPKRGSVIKILTSIGAI